jgi:hypothetical protein
MCDWLLRRLDSTAFLAKGTIIKARHWDVPTVSFSFSTAGFIEMFGHSGREGKVK